jgi:glycosyltransferase involved in cell wall biosynthesis
MIPEAMVVIPAYNEEQRLKKNAARWRDALRSYRCILVDDGSSDNTAETAKELGFWGVLRHESNKGKGAAVRTGVLKALELGAETVLFADADLSAGPDAWEKVLAALGEADVAVGSRLAKSAEVKRSLKREVCSRAFSYLRRFLLPLPVLDTQCGCKAFTRRAAEKLFARDLQFSRYEFDLEIILRAKAMQLEIKEVGIRWAEEKGGKVNFIRDTVRLLKAICCLRSSAGELSAKGTYLFRSISG